MQLRAADAARIREQKWDLSMGGNPIVRFRGREYLRQRTDGSCVFLLADGRCRVHADFGFESKPIACQLFPYMLSPSEGSSRMGVSFACQSVIENKGALVNGQASDALRIALRGVPEVVAVSAGALLCRGRAAEAGELRALEDRLVRWIARDAPLAERIDGLAWIAQSLAAANLRAVRGQRMKDLVNLLFDALADELPHHPIDPPSARQVAMLQSAVFSRTEDPKPLSDGASGRVTSTLGQLRRSRVWRRGKKGVVVPHIGIGWSNRVTFGQVARVRSIDASKDHADCNELVTRWMRSSIEGGRIWGSGYYGWNAVDGLGAFMFAIASVGWLARFHAAGEGIDAPSIAGLRAAIGRIDRTAGRAAWLGGWVERARLAFLTRDDGLRRIAAAQYGYRAHNER